LRAAHEPANSIWANAERVGVPTITKISSGRTL
jgi:hypothetical protein